MTTAVQYLEEETGYIPDSDLPARLGRAELVRVLEATFSFEVTRADEDDYEEEIYEEGSYPVLELTVNTGEQEETFIVISPNDEEWYYYETIDDFISETYYDTDDVSYNYEVISDENAE